MPPDPLEEEIRTLAKRLRRAPLFEDGPDTVALDYGGHAIRRLLRHRDPFLFVDRLTAFDPSQRAMRGLRRVEPGDPVFAGHFPGHPIYPGVLQLEAMGQLAICLSWMVTNGPRVDEHARPLDVRALKVHQATFLAPVGPGAELTLSARLLADDGRTTVCAGQLSSGETIVALAVMEMLHVE